jgi:hypothetical protein
MGAELLELEDRLDRELIDWRVDGQAASRSAPTARLWCEAAWSLAEAQGPAELAADDVRAGLALAGRPVFICGVHRSGTTLVRDLLDSHPQLNVLPAEGLFFTNLRTRIATLDAERALGVVGRHWLQRLVDPSSQPPFWLLGRSSGGHSPYVSFVRALMAWWHVVERVMGGQVKSWPLVSAMLAYAYSRAGGRIADGQVRWAEKTPTNEQFINRLLADFPQAKIIHVIRDPISVFASRKSMELQTFGSFGNRRVVLKDLARSYRVALSRRNTPFAGRYLLTRYEDLVDQPRPEIERLAAFLEIRSLPVLWRPTVSGIPVGSNSSFGVRAPSGEILTVPGEVPQRELDRRDTQLVGCAVGGLASRLGYAIAPASGWRDRLRGLYFRI